MGPPTLSEQLGHDLSTAKDYIAAYYSRYQGGALQRCSGCFGAGKRVCDDPFPAQTISPDIEHKNRMIRAESERMAINTPIQGTAADLIKKAMIRIHERLREEKLKTRLLLQVHDELLFEVLEEELSQVSGLVKEEMEGLVHRLDVPLGVNGHQDRKEWRKRIERENTEYRRQSQNNGVLEYWSDEVLGSTRTYRYSEL